MSDKLRNDEAIPSPLADARRGSVTRLNDLPPDRAKRAELECPDFETRPWMTGPETVGCSLVMIGDGPFCSACRDGEERPLVRRL
jgi:hypothetical protein